MKRRTSTMRLILSCLPLALLFLASVVPVKAQSEASATEEAGGEGTLRISEEPSEVLYYDVGRNLSLRCPLPNDKSLVYVWKKNGTAIEEVSDLKDRYRLEAGGAVFAIAGRSNEDDYGNYSCALRSAADAAGQPSPPHAWDVRGRPHSKMPLNTNVVEAQTLKLQCKVIGKPYPAITWLYSNESESEGSEANGTEVRAALGARVSLNVSEQGVPDGLLVLERAQRSDAGRFVCRVSDTAALNAVTTLRVKDMYAALWPFLGICAEVFVLCAIILVYEKRRTKPELDDSDTDNHDQKKS